MHNVKIYKPPRELSHLICFYWTLDGYNNSQNSTLHRIMANYKPEFFFHYGEHVQEVLKFGLRDIDTSGILGQANKVRMINIKKDVGLFSVVIQPYLFPILFKTSSSEITNELIGLNLLLGYEAEKLTDSIILAKTTESRIKLFNNWLLKRYERIKRPDIVHSTHHIYNCNGIVDVKALARNANLSQRQFERVFKELNGFSPKTFSKLVRFNQLARSNFFQDKSLTELAHLYGYFDQSHFIEEFKSYSGYTPHNYYYKGVNDVFFAPNQK